MLKIKYHKQFKKDYKKALKRGLDDALLKDVITLLAEEKTLPEKYRDHALSGEYNGCRECHVQPDWLLIYEINNNELILILNRTGTHSDLF